MNRRISRTIAIRFFENGARLLVRDQIEITLPVTRLDVLKPVPFLRQRPQRFPEQLELVDFQGRLAGLGEETIAFDADEIAEIDQLEKLDHLLADFLRVDVNLDPPGRIAQVDEMAFAHVAMRGDAAGRAQGRRLRRIFRALPRSCRKFRKRGQKGLRRCAWSASNFSRRCAMRLFSSSMFGWRLFTTFPGILTCSLIVTYGSYRTYRSNIRLQKKPAR